MHDRLETVASGWRQLLAPGDSVHVSWDMFCAKLIQRMLFFLAGTFQQSKMYSEALPKLRKDECLKH
jgi:hypothetical protein